jgi:hypothetical protein
MGGSLTLLDRTPDADPDAPGACFVLSLPAAPLDADGLDADGR